MRYIFTSDGSWAPARDTVVIDVPEEIQDADAIEEYLQAYNGDAVSVESLCIQE